MLGYCFGGPEKKSSHSIGFISSLDHDPCDILGEYSSRSKYQFHVVAYIFELFDSCYHVLLFYLPLFGDERKFKNHFLCEKQHHQNANYTIHHHSRLFCAPKSICPSWLQCFLESLGLVFHSSLHHYDIILEFLHPTIHQFQKRRFQRALRIKKGDNKLKHTFFFNSSDYHFTFFFFFFIF